MGARGHLQTTVVSSVSFCGIGIHSGKESRLVINPALADTGLVISKKLEDGQLTVPTSLTPDLVCNTAFCTVLKLGEASNAIVSTVEHVLSALAGLGIDNAHIVLDGDEVPILDGSAYPFVNEILDVGIKENEALKKFVKIRQEVHVRHEDATASLLPYNGRVFDVQVAFDHPLIRNQRVIFEWSPSEYCRGVAQARTFGFIKDAEAMRKAGLALGASLDNSIAMDDKKVLNPDGLRHSDEFVRHKLLDAIGDICMAGYPIYGLFRSSRSGHRLNAMLISQLMSDEANYEIVDSASLPFEFDHLYAEPERMPVVAQSLRSFV